MSEDLQPVPTRRTKAAAFTKEAEAEPRSLRKAAAHGGLLGPGHLGFDSGLLAEEGATHSVPGCQEQPSQEDADQPSELFGSRDCSL